MRRAYVLLSLVAMNSSCGAPIEVVPPLTGMRLLDPDLVLSELQGSLHLRVFPKRELRCDAATGRVLDASGNRVLQGPFVDPVTPAARCAQGFAANASNTATPVDLCVARDMPSTVSISAAGTYIVLVHGQGNFALPNGMTLPGTLGAGCAEVTLAPAQQQSVTVGVHRQVPQGRCGDAMVDFDETCDLGAAMNNGTSGCSAQCQTLEFAVNTNTAGEQRHASTVWAPGQRLIVAFDATNVATEDAFARYFTAEGARETTPAVLANDITLGGGRGVQAVPRLCASAGGFVGAWETYEFSPRIDIAAQSFGYGTPTTSRVLMSTPMASPTGTLSARSPSIAASATRVVAVWQDNTARGVRTLSVPLATPLAAVSTEAVSVADGETSDARVVASGNGFLVAWASAGDIFSRRLDANGVPVGAAVRVNPSAGEAQDQPSLSALGDGSVVVAWRDAARDMQDGDGTSIRWVRVGVDGTPETTARVANTTVAGDQARPTVATVSPTGGMPAVLIAWEDTATGSIRARLVRPDGSEVISRVAGSAADFQVSTGPANPGARREPSAAGGGPGGTNFAVAWEAPDSAGAGIFARIFPL